MRKLSTLLLFSLSCVACAQDTSNIDRDYESMLMKANFLRLESYLNLLTKYQSRANYEDILADIELEVLVSGHIAIMTHNDFNSLSASQVSTLCEFVRFNKKRNI